MLAFAQASAADALAEVDADGEQTAEKDAGTGGDVDMTAASKRDRSVLEAEGSVELVAGSGSTNEGERAAKRIKLANGTGASVFHAPTAAPATSAPQVHATPSPQETAESTVNEPAMTLGQDLSLRRVRAEPGMPLHPSPRLTHRANWVSQLKSSQAQQKEILAQVSAPSVESSSSSTRAPIPSSSSFPTRSLPSSAPSLVIPSASASSSKPRTPAHRPTSTPSSPLTEQSESANGDADDDVEMVTPIVRSPRFGMNGRGGTRRLSKVRIQSTPPSDTEGGDPPVNSAALGTNTVTGSTSTNGRSVGAQTTPAAGLAVVLHPPSASSDTQAELPIALVHAALPPHQRGPPKLRRWFTKQAAPPPPTPALTSEPALPPPSVPPTTPAAPSPRALPSPKPIPLDPPPKAMEIDSVPKVVNSRKFDIA